MGKKLRWAGMLLAGILGYGTVLFPLPVQGDVPPPDLPVEVTGAELGSLFYASPGGTYEVYRETLSDTPSHAYNNRTGRWVSLSANNSQGTFRADRYVLSSGYGHGGIPTSIDLETGARIPLSLETGGTWREVLWQERYGQEPALQTVERTVLGIDYHEGNGQYITLSALPGNSYLAQREEGADRTLWLDFYGEDGGYLRSLPTPCEAGLYEDVFRGEWIFRSPQVYLWGDFAVFYDYTGKGNDEYGRIACVNIYDGSLWYMDGILCRVAGDRLMVLDIDRDRWGNYYLQGEQYLGGERVSAIWLPLHTREYPVTTWYLQYRPLTNVLTVQAEGLMGQDGEREYFSGAFDFAQFGGPSPMTSLLG